MCDGPAREPAPDFDADTSVTQMGVHRYGTALLERWNVVAGPNGGYLAALLARAMTNSIDEPARSLRTLTVHFLSRPDFDEVEIAVDIIRAGRSLSTVQATMRQGDRLVCSSIAAFSVPWESNETWSLPMSVHAHDESRLDLDGPPPPVHGNWSGQPIVDAPFFSGEGSSRVGQWIRARRPRTLDAIELVAICDAIPPASFPRMTTPAAMPSVDLTVHIRTSLPLVDPPADERVYAECNTHHVADGFADEDCHIWSADGRLLAQSRQLAITR
ncbi:MAG: thioesterase family protein [Acidimicrobiales bacterium]